MTKTKQKSILGSVLLIAGCCIGAGMIGLPLVSMSTGFTFSLISLVVGWLYMYLSGMMILEVYHVEKVDVNLMGLLQRVLGKSAKLIGALLFAFLFYSLLTAYLNASSIIIKNTFDYLLHRETPQLGVLIVNSLILYILILLGTRKIDIVNRVLFILMILFYAFLVIFGISKVNQESIKYSMVSPDILFAIPVYIISFGYQNLLATINHYLGGNVKKTKKAILWGTLTPLAIYIIWNFVVLGSLSVKEHGAVNSTVDLISQLYDGTSPFLTFLINGFSLFAIVTSLLTVAFSFVNFLSDKSENQTNRAFFSACVIVPPFIISLADPDVFLKAIHIAGGLAATALFGLLPAMMIWKSRAKHPKGKFVFPFGKWAIIAFVVFTIAVMLIEVVNIAL
ncbi:MAG: aromatic amino acid transport family protein [Rhabdochlamydiaceae bacterium]|nr:aromatic amino acid transport family protein [Candidatus Amphrikana amoebophyrae]